MFKFKEGDEVSVLTSYGQRRLCVVASCLGTKVGGFGIDYLVSSPEGEDIAIANEADMRYPEIEDLI